MRSIASIASIATIATIVTIATIGCSSEDTLEPQAPQQTLTVVAAGERFVDKAPATRALPSGYIEYKDPESVGASIGVWMTRAGEDPDLRRLDWDESHWHAKINIQAFPYWIYGLMPRELATTATIRSKNGTGGADFENGAVITAEVNTLTNDDICTIVGVKKSTTDVTIAESGIVPGAFEYEGVAEDEHNYLYVLLKHLYAALHFKVSIDAGYNALRAIKVKSMTLTTAAPIYNKVTLQVTLTPNGTGADPTAITYTNAGTSETTSLTLFNNPTEPFTVPLAADPKELWAYFAPGKCSNFELYTEYDVYYRKTNGEIGDLVREGCTAHNKLNVSEFTGFSTLTAGDKYVINLTIEPTYLYILADPDLDNPTIKIED